MSPSITAALATGTNAAPSHVIVETANAIDNNFFIFYFLVCYFLDL
jgi:hypothetical protein